MPYISQECMNDFVDGVKGFLSESHLKRIIGAMDYYFGYNYKER